MAIEEHGHIIHQSLPCIPQLNLLEKRIDETLLNKARSLLDNARIPKLYWGDAIIQAADLYNWMVAKNLNSTKKGKSSPWHNTNQFKYADIWVCCVSANIKENVYRKVRTTSRKINIFGKNARPFTNFCAHNTTDDIDQTRIFLTKTYFRLLRSLPYRRIQSWSANQGWKMNKKYPLAIHACYVKHNWWENILLWAL